MKTICLWSVQKQAAELQSFSQLECFLWNTFVGSCLGSDICPLFIVLVENQPLTNDENIVWTVGALIFCKIWPFFSPSPLTFPVFKMKAFKILVCLCAVLATEPRALWVLGKCSRTDLSPRFVWILVLAFWLIKMSQWRFPSLATLVMVASHAQSRERAQASVSAPCSFSWVMEDLVKFWLNRTLTSVAIFQNWQF